jgi:alpha-tubulin suppressor-like RCC1 family protein
MAAVGNVVAIGRAAAGGAAGLATGEGKEGFALSARHMVTSSEGITAISQTGQPTDAISELAAAVHVTGVAHGNQHSVAVTHLGSVYTWGNGTQGQLGQPRLTA